LHGTLTEFGNVHPKNIMEQIQHSNVIRCSVLGQ